MKLKGIKKPPYYFQCGDVAVIEFSRTKLWLQHRDGEGLMVSRKQFAKWLETMFWKEF